MSTHKTDLDGGGPSGADWVLSIKNEFSELRKRSHRPKPKCTMFRVPEELLNVKKEDYAPSEISLGLFKRKPINAPKTRGDKLRLEIAFRFLDLEVVGEREDVKYEWANLCKLVVPEPSETQDLYDELGRDPLSLEEVQNVLTLDAIFLTCFLAHLPPQNMDEFPQLECLLALIKEDISNHCIEYDIIMAENQIPFKLIQNVVHILYVEKERGDKFLRLICANFVRLLEEGLPGCPDLKDSKAKNADDLSSFNFSECDNILDCGYRWLVHDIDIENFYLDPEDKPLATELPNTPPESKGKGRGSIDFGPSMPSVTRLQEAGIDFRGSTGGFHCVRFERRPVNHATLFLPIFTIHDKSELLWRNLLAFEQMQTLKGENNSNYYQHFGSFIDFMDSLIDTTNDALCLAKGDPPVLKQIQIGNHEAVAKLFNNKLKENYILYKEWGALKTKIHVHFDYAPRRMCVDFIRTNFGKPWFTISILGAVIVLIATVLSAVYTILGFYL